MYQTKLLCLALKLQSGSLQVHVCYNLTEAVFEVFVNKRFDALSTLYLSTCLPEKISLLRMLGNLVDWYYSAGKKQVTSSLAAKSDALYVSQLFHSFYLFAISSLYTLMYFQTLKKITVTYYL